MQPDLIYDVGMHNGDDTAYYLHRGYRVVAIDADPTLVEKGRERFRDAVRDGKLTILNVGIDTEERTGQFWLAEADSVWNSFDPEVPKRYGSAARPIAVACRPLRNIIRENGVPFYLKIDIEGRDHMCIKDIDPADPPQYVSFEMTRLEDLVLLAQKGYASFKCIEQSRHRQLLALAQQGLAVSTLERVREAARRNPALHRVAMKGMQAVRRASGANRGSERPGWAFARGSAGPFAEETAGAWQTLDEVAYAWLDQCALVRRRNGPEALPWVDIHARRSAP